MQGTVAGAQPAPGEKEDSEKDATSPLVADRGARDHDDSGVRCAVVTLRRRDRAALCIILAAPAAAVPKSPWTLAVPAG